METGTYKQVLYGIENNKYYTLFWNGNSVEKKYYDTLEELKNYIDNERRDFV